VLKISGLRGIGLDELWENIEEHHRVFAETGELDDIRRHQRIKWMWSMIEDKLMDAVKTHPQVRGCLPRIREEVEAGTTTVPVAVLEVLRAFGLDVGLSG
jgi:LAO/AO transport system kinase